MAEYIDRDAVLAILSDKNAAWDGYAKVKAIPAEDVIERRQGKWLYTPTHWAFCSKCGGEPPEETNIITRFCSNCGAEMENYEQLPSYKEYIEWLRKESKDGAV